MTYFFCNILIINIILLADSVYTITITKYIIILKHEENEQYLKYPEFSIENIKCGSVILVLQVHT